MRKSSKRTPARATKNRAVNSTENSAPNSNGSQAVAAHPPRAFNDPVAQVRWVHRDRLRPNDYNPNKVAPPELELLTISILEDGWTQPIVVLEDMTIVDGFHRYTVSACSRLMARYDGFVPVVVVRADPVHRKMSTIRHNRARGTHGVLPMADIVQGMVRDGVEKAEIARRLQMEDEEVDRLCDRAGMPDQAARQQAGFGKSWRPE